MNFMSEPLARVEAFRVTATYEGVGAAAIFVLKDGEWDQYPEHRRQEIIDSTIKDVAYAAHGDVPWTVTVDRSSMASLCCEPMDNGPSL